MFNSHEAVEISFHKDLVKPGLVPKEFSSNLELARTIIEAVYRLHPGTVSKPSWMETKHPEP